MPSLQTSTAPRILIVDDMAINRKMLAFAFNTTDFDIVEATTGEKALELVNSQRFDCVLLDQLMPGLTGYETLIELRKNFSQLELPIIIVTALYDAENIATALKNGANDYVTKPFDNTVILARVQLQLDRKNADIKMKQAKEDAEKAHQAKSTFIASMSHELKTPLNAIQGFSQLLEMEFENNEKAMASVHHILASSHHLLTIVDDLLAISKIEAGKIELDIKSFSIFSMISLVADNCQPLIAKNGNQLEIICPDKIGEMQSDSVRLTQVLFNLLSNAAKFTIKGQISVIVDSFDNDRWLRFTVKDTGIGISEAHQQKLFTDFFQVQEALHLNPQGTGLGLSISLRLTQLLGGNISVHSTLNEGSEFIVKLPRKASSL